MGNNNNNNNIKNKCNVFITAVLMRDIINESNKHHSQTQHNP